MGAVMGRELEAMFYECPECNRFTLLGAFASEDACPSCGSQNGSIISASQLENRLESGTTMTIDLSPARRERPKRQ